MIYHLESLNGYVVHEWNLSWTQGFFMYIMLLLYHVLIKDDLTTLISNLKILDKLCNEYSKGIYLDI